MKYWKSPVMTRILYWTWTTERLPVYWFLPSWRCGWWWGRRGRGCPLPSQRHEKVSPGIASPGKDLDSELLVRLLLNAYHLRTIVTSESCQSNRPKSGTICNWFRSYSPLAKHLAKLTCGFQNVRRPFHVLVFPFCHFRCNFLVLL